jgi:RHS repeat-associated protein
MSGVSTDYVLDGDSGVRTLVSGATDKTWLTGPRGPEYERSGAGAAVWNLFDGLGSVTGTVDSSGNIVSARKYDVYGSVRQLTGPSGTKRKFVGQLGHPSEDETGLVYMRARYYDPITGAFASEDPAREGANWFQYALGRPNQVVDATGRNPITDFMGDLFRVYAGALSGGAEGLGCIPGGPGNVFILLGAYMMSLVPFYAYNAAYWTYFGLGYTIQACEIPWEFFPAKMARVFMAAWCYLDAGWNAASAAVLAIYGRQLMMFGQMENDDWRL